MQERVMPADAKPFPEDSSLETPDVSTRAVWMSVAGFMLFALLAMAALLYFFGDKIAKQPDPVTVFSEPRLQSAPRRDRDEVEAAQRARLEHGRMSIDDAMARIVARGDKAFDPVDDAAKEAP
jgi:hypothetical protein